MMSRHTMASAPGVNGGFPYCPPKDAHDAASFHGQAYLPPARNPHGGGAR